MSSPKVSILLPTYNRSRILPRTIGSVLAQDEKDFELIVVDDCSIDDTSAYLASLDDPRIRTLRPSTNLGTEAARNFGLSAARADIVALLDDDDVYLEHRLSAPLAVFEREPDVVATLSSSIQLNPKRTHVEQMPELTLAPAAFEWALICNLVGVAGTGVTVRRQMALDVGGFTVGTKWADDREFLIKASRRGSGHLIAKSLWQKHWSDSGQSNQWRRAGLSLMSYVAARPELVGRFRKMGSYLANQVLVLDLRHWLFGSFVRDFRAFRRAGLVDYNLLRMWREHREVRSYRRAMSRHEALATLTQAPDDWN